jgi:quaternary ammonium compound-resistance protein SugE
MPLVLSRPRPGGKLIASCSIDAVTQGDVAMAWLVLVVSGVFEAVWATALGKSEGFSRPAPTVVFAVALLISMGGLAYAMRELPTGASYAVWVGVGASLTVAYAMVFDGEEASVVKILLLLGIVACVVGLKVLH